jgi:hypothetical protein
VTRRLHLLLDQISPWRRGFTEGWNCGVAEGMNLVEDLLKARTGHTFTRADLADVAFQLRRELTP